MARRGAGLFSVTTLLASFFGAAMVAAAFAYFNYKFSEYKFVNFSEWVFYQKKTLFTPTAEKYVVVFYSSNVPGTAETLKEAKAAYPILAVDYYQQSFESTENTLFVRSGTNTTLQLIQRFNIYHTPTVFIIKKVKDGLYKQDSMIRQLDTLEEITKEY